MRIARHFTRENHSPFSGIKLRRIPISALLHRCFETDQDIILEVPAEWTRARIEAFAAGRVFRDGIPTRLRMANDAQVPEWLQRSEPDEAALAALSPHERTRPETSVLDICRRLSGAWTYWGWICGYFDEERDAQAFFDEICHMLAWSIATPSVATWRSLGLHWAYGINEASRYCYIDALTGEIQQKWRHTEERLVHAQLFDAPANPARDSSYRPEAEINLAAFLRSNYQFDHQSFCYAARLWTVALDISIFMAQYPDAARAEAARGNRPIQLRHTSVVGLSAIAGQEPSPTDAAALNTALHSLLAARAFATSAEIAAELGAFPAYTTEHGAAMTNLRSRMTGALAPHIAGMGTSQHVGTNGFASSAIRLIAGLADRIWNDALTHSAEHGIRHAETTAANNNPSAEEIPSPRAFTDAVQLKKEPAGAPAPAAHFPLPTRRVGWIEDLTIDGQVVRLRTEEYPGGSIGALHMEMLEADTQTQHLLNCISSAITIGLQHGVPLDAYIKSFTSSRVASPATERREPGRASAQSILEQALSKFAQTSFSADPTGKVTAGSAEIELESKRNSGFGACPNCSSTPELTRRHDGTLCTHCTEDFPVMTFGHQTSELGNVQ